ncbi:hypothetical protein J7E62_30430 [Variovorax paradoxus]|nr:hypothetical protein [Variovorax paradoxus]
MTFARTKIQPPRFRVGLIERGELERKLGAALLGRRLVLLMASAGYGKTAALSRQLSLLPAGCATAWVTADEQDDLERFLACLTAALEPHDPPWRVAPEALAGAMLQESGLRPVVSEFVNTLDAMPVEHGVIALDDVHSVADTRVFDFLEELVEGLPQHWTLAMATRTAPPFSVARLRGQRELAEFGQADLGFSRDEVQRLCEPLRLDDGAEVARQLHERTQGWAAGICLSLSTAAGPAAASDSRLSQRHLFDYLASEVFEEMSAELREFLMRCSVLPELTASRCATVSGNPRAADLLDEIERRGLFVSVLDSEELTLRLHDLFRDFLEDRLRREHGDELPTLLQLAARGEADTVRKVNLLLRAGAWEEAEQALARATAYMLAKGDGSQVLRLIEQFPADARSRSPQLAYLRGLCAWLVLQFSSMCEEMSRAAIGFERKGELQAAQRARAAEAVGAIAFKNQARGRMLLATIGDLPVDLETRLAMEFAALWDTMINGPAESPGQHLNQLGLLLEKAPPALWHQCFPWMEMMMGRRGIRAPAQRIIFAASIVAADHNFGRLQSVIRVAEVSLSLWQGRFGELESGLQQLEADEHWLGGRVKRHPNPWVLRSLCAAMRGDRETIRAAAEEKNDFFPPLYRKVLAAKGICNAAVGEWDAVVRVLGVWEDDAAMHGSFWKPFKEVLQARLALSQQRNEEAALLLRESVKTSSDVDRFGLDGMVRVHLAIATHRLGSPAAAWQAVAPLVDGMRDSEEIGSVLICGLSSLKELANAPWGAHASAEGVAELQRWAQLSREAQVGERPAALHPAATQATASSPLSTRELEVLACIATGESNKLIARALDLSPHTVKRHVARILDRLDLDSRGEAAAWYHRHMPAEIRAP